MRAIPPRLFSRERVGGKKSLITLFYNHDDAAWWNTIEVSSREALDPAPGVVYSGSNGKPSSLRNQLRSLHRASPSTKCTLYACLLASLVFGAL